MERIYLKDSRIIKLEKELECGNNTALKEFWDYLKSNGAPLIEDIEGDKEFSLVTLIYKEKKKLNNVVLIPPVGMRKLENCIMDKIQGTDVWYISYKVEKNIRFSYQFSPDDPLNNDWERRWKNVQDDEFNKNKLNFSGKVSDKYRMVPYAVMENAREHIWIKEDKDSGKGTLERHKLHSEVLRGERNITVYLPHGYSKNNNPYGVLILNDGFEYINILNAENVLNNLISKGKILPIIAVFVDATKDRALNLKCSNEFSEFLAVELIDFIKERYNISDDASKNVIGGYSLGGLAASYTALKYSTIFGNVLSQSGSYWYKEDGYDACEKCWMSMEFSKVKKLPIKFYINVGSIEPKVSMIDTNIEFSESLKKLGYEVKFEQFGSGHDYLWWGETLAYGLQYLIGIK